MHYSGRSFWLNDSENCALVDPTALIRLGRVKKLLIFAGAIALGYFLFVYDDGPAGVYTEDGSPRTIMFVTEQCGRACVDMRKSLLKRVDFEEVDAFDQGESSALYKEYGGTGYLPYIVMNKQRIIAFVEYDIEKDRAASRDYNALPGSGTPLLFQGYARISGFDVRRLEQEFDL